ncbi:8374_t:CDS:2, partial [Cetraspora pellucida]
KDELPLSSKRKETENKHCVYYLDPFIKLIFGGEYTPYSLELNKSIKPLGYTQLRKDQDFVKVHLKGKKSINKLLEKGGPNKSIAFLNMGDTIESSIIDLAYDGVYRSWPCLKNKLAIDKGSFPLSVLTFSHFIIIEQYLNEIVNDYENRSPSEQIEEL